MGHSRSDPAKYRPPGELEEWLARDPIVLLERKLAEDVTDPARIAELKEQVRQAVLEALERAKSWPDPELDARFANVLA